MLIEPRIVAWARRGPKWRRVPVCPGPVLRPRNGNGSHLRPHPRRETIEGSIGIYTSRSTRSGIERGAIAGVLQSRLISPLLWRFNLAQSRVKRSQPIIRSKWSLYEDMCSTLNRLKTPRWADTTRVGSALHPTLHGTRPRHARPGPAPIVGGPRERLTVAACAARCCPAATLATRSRAPPSAGTCTREAGWDSEGRCREGGGVARRGELGRQPGHAPAQRGRSRRHPARQRRCLKCLMISAPRVRPARRCGGARGRTSACPIAHRSLRGKRQVRAPLP